MAAMPLDKYILSLPKGSGWAENQARGERAESVNGY